MGKKMMKLSDLTKMYIGSLNTPSFQILTTALRILK